MPDIRSIDDIFTVKTTGIYPSNFDVQWVAQKSVSFN